MKINVFIINVILFDLLFYYCETTVASVVQPREIRDVNCLNESKGCKKNTNFHSEKSSEDYFMDVRENTKNSSQKDIVEHHHHYHHHHYHPNPQQREQDSRSFPRNNYGYENDRNYDEENRNYGHHRRHHKHHKHSGSDSESDSSESENSNSSSSSGSSESKEHHGRRRKHKYHHNHANSDNLHGNSNRRSYHSPSSHEENLEYNENDKNLNIGQIYGRDYRLRKGYHRDRNEENISNSSTCNDCQHPRNSAVATRQDDVSETQA